MPESNLQIQVERTPEGHFVKGQSGNPAGKPLGCRNRGADPEGHGIRPRW
jgi:hypothetical protein